MGNFKDIMVDIETTGTTPETTSIIQISAVRFNLQEQTLDTESMFDRCLWPAPKRFWDEDTRQWWMGKNLGVYQMIAKRMEDPAAVIKDFRDWAKETDDGEFNEPIRFWSKPTTFDFMFLASYFDQYGHDNPFFYRAACDVNSYIRGLAGDPNANCNIVQFDGAAHNAIIDVLNQIKNLFAAVNHYKGEAR